MMASIHGNFSSSKKEQKLWGSLLQYASTKETYKGARASSIELFDMDLNANTLYTTSCGLSPDITFLSKTSIRERNILEVEACTGEISSLNCVTLSNGLSTFA